LLWWIILLLKIKGDAVSNAVAKDKGKAQSVASADGGASVANSISGDDSTADASG
jgi:hypothetical protein